jgi:hypothetical protein
VLKILDFFLLFALVSGLVILGDVSGLASNRAVDVARHRLAAIVWAPGANAIPPEPSAPADPLRGTKDWIWRVCANDGMVDLSTNLFIFQIIRW